MVCLANSVGLRRSVVVSSLGKTVPEGISLMKVAGSQLKLQPEGTQVVIEVAAAAVNYPDLLMTAGQYQLKPSLPFTPGMEISGTVVRAGPDVKRFKQGDRVMAALRYGGFSSHVMVDQAQIMPLPASLTFVQGAAFTIGYITAYHGLVERADVQNGEHVLIHGATGGVGLAAVQLAIAKGCNVMITGGDRNRLTQVKEIAMQTCPNAKNVKLDIHVLSEEPQFRSTVKAWSGGVGADVVYDPVGGDVFDESLRCTAFGGRILSIGFASGRRPSAPVNLLLIKGISLIGARAGEWGRRKPEVASKRMKELFHLAQEEHLMPYVSHVFPLERVQEAFMVLWNREVVGKCVVDMRIGQKSSNL
eukprot:Clim_evm20s128 gene=Clim_evmTU20s128